MFELTVFNEEGVEQRTFSVDSPEELAARLTEILEYQPEWKAKVTWIGEEDDEEGKTDPEAGGRDHLG